MFFGLSRFLLRSLGNLNIIFRPQKSFPRACPHPRQPFVYPRFSFAFARPRTARPSSPRCHDFCICFASKNPLTAHPNPRASAPSALRPPPTLHPHPSTHHPPSALSANLLEVQISRHRPLFYPHIAPDPYPSVETDGNELHFDTHFGLRPNRVTSPCHRLSTTLSSLCESTPSFMKWNFAVPFPSF